jgi:HlyD family secretion protein
MSINLLTPHTKGMGRSRYWLAITGTVTIGVIGLISWQVWQTPRTEVSDTQVESTTKISTVTALGRLEPAGKIVNVTAPTANQQNRMKSLLVQEGDRVENGQIIAVLDNEDPLQAAVASAEKQVRIAQARLAQVKAGVKTGELQAQRAEIDRLQAENAGAFATQQATIRRLAAEVENARTEYERYQFLYRQGAVSASEHEARKLVLTTARQELEAAQSELARAQNTNRKQIKQAQATLNQLAEVRAVDVELAEAELAAATAAVAEAKSNLEKAYVRAPQAGQIIKIYTRAGENLASEGIAALGDTQQMMAIAEVYQSDIQAVQIGQPVTIASPVVPGTLHGTVERIGLQVESQQVVDDDPAANTDAKVIEVPVRLNSASSETVAGLTNLQVTVTIITDS